MSKTKYITLDDNGKELETSIKGDLKKRLKLLNPTKIKNKKPAIGITYKDRNLILKTLGFNNYKAYLRSDLWKSIRAKVFKEKGNKCKCGRSAKMIHHIFYDKETLLGKRLKYLIPICGLCHKSIEFDNSKKLKPQKVEEKRKHWNKQTTLYQQVFRE